jgi:hypothetical protein
VSATDRLIRKAGDYEVLAASHGERAALPGGREHTRSAIAFTVAAIIPLEGKAHTGSEPTA